MFIRSIFVLQILSLAAFEALVILGRAITAKAPRIKTTINISTNVKAFIFLILPGLYPYSCYS
ncbi:MAG: hypothetical protein A2167_06565 [Planctomycetes bacterium RBG_13_46_10]|nr:MAG: hypothetical protein A2167_06565 [Planctomycetes bacterium RBG_13_46_10]